MRKIIFLIMFGLIFANFTYGQEVAVTSIKINCINLNSNLKQGMKGNPDIVVLQNFLKGKGYLKAEATGFFGTQTLKGVKAFQKANNISPTGFVGSITRASIDKITCIVVEPPIVSLPTPENTPTTPNVTIPAETEVVAPPVVEDVILTAPNNSSLKVKTDGVITITNNSVLVRGSVVEGARSGTERWFELTTNPTIYKLSETTISPKISQRANDNFEQLFSGLTSETTYYFRVCAENVSVGQKSCGGTVSVKTN